MLQNFWNEQPITGRTKDDVSYVNLKKNLFTVVHKLILRLRVTIFNVMITVEIAVVFYTKIEYKTKHLYRIYLGVIKL